MILAAFIAAVYFMLFISVYKKPKQATKNLNVTKKTIEGLFTILFLSSIFSFVIYTQILFNELDPERVTLLANVKNTLQNISLGLVGYVLFRIQNGRY
jgi:hypothetical protein